MNKKELSICCNAPIETAYAGYSQITNFYICSTCGKACDIKQQTRGRMKTIKIYGAGMAGLLAGVILSKKFNIQIIEKQPKLEKKHFALLRFKDNSIEEATGIQCQKVTIKKAICYSNQLYKESNILFDNLYSKKVTNKILDRSIGNLQSGTRYIPPHDFYEQLIELNKGKIQLNTEVKELEENAISTIPLFNMYKNFKKDNIQFQHKSIYVKCFKCYHINVHQTIYFPEEIAQYSAYRISIIGDRIICECISPQTPSSTLLYQINKAFGISSKYIRTESMDINEQQLGKIIPINEQQRQTILYNLTEQHGIYSLGRYACWRNIMLPDVVKDIHKISNWISMKQNLSNYEIKKKII